MKSTQHFLGVTGRRLLSNLSKIAEAIILFGLRDAISQGSFLRCELFRFVRPCQPISYSSDFRKKYTMRLSRVILRARCSVTLPQLSTPCDMLHCCSKGCVMALNRRWSLHRPAPLRNILPSASGPPGGRPAATLANAKLFGFLESEAHPQQTSS